MTLMDATTIRTHNVRKLIADAGGPAEWLRKYGGEHWQQAQVAQWISHKRPKGIGGRLARKLEQVMELPYGALDHPDDEDFPLTAAAATPSDYLRLQHLDAEAGMGGARVNLDHPEIIGEQTLAREYIRQVVGFVPRPGRLVLLTGRGDSMLPTIAPGDLLIVDTGITAFDYDGLYLINLGNGQQVKRLVDRGGGQIHVCSDNRLYDPFVMPEDALIGGKVYLRQRIERLA